MKRFSLESNMIANVPAILRRHWRNVRGPLKWILVGVGVALLGVLSCTKTIR